MRQLAFLMVGILLFTACGNQGNSDAADFQRALESSGDFSGDLEAYRESQANAELGDDIEIEPPRSPEVPPSPQFAYYDEQKQPVHPIENKQSEKKLIRTAQVDIKVDGYSKAKTTLDELLQQFQAEVTNESQNSSSDGYRYYFTIKVLPTDFEPFIAKVESFASFVYSKNIQVQDVTRQYVDLETRLSSKRAVIAQYRALLQDAKSVEDVLAVNEELNEVIEDVESTEAQLRALRNDVQFSTINLTIFDEHTIPNVERENFFSRIGKGLFNGWQLFLNIFVGLITAWPVLLILVASVWFFRRWWRKRKSTKES